MNKQTESPSVTESPYLRGQGAAAKYAQVSKRTISEWQARGIIPYLKPARKVCLFRKADIDRALTRYEVKGGFCGADLLGALAVAVVVASLIVSWWAR